jgi:ATP-dependent protease ClpP protease subunit
VTIDLVGSVNKHMLRDLLDGLADAAGEPVTVRITSHGGSPDIALAIAGHIRAYGADTEVYGQCYSAATLIFAAGISRRMQKWTWVMVHESSELVDGNATALKQAAKNMQKQEDHWNSIMQELTGTDAKIWEKMSLDTYLTADECLKLGLATEIF